MKLPSFVSAGGLGRDPRAVAGDARFVVCHGGARDEFDRVRWREKVFVDDPSLRGPPQHLQSLTQIFETLWREYFARDAELDSLYVIEYDHLILDGAFEDRLREVAQVTAADLLGKRCVDLTATNVAHYVRSLAPEDPPATGEVVRASRVEGALPATVDDEAWDAAESAACASTAWASPCRTAFRSMETIVSPP